MKAVQHFLHKNLLVMLLSMYAIALMFPKFGNYLRTIFVGTTSSGMNVSLTMMMLAFLLFSAGLGIKTSEFRNISGSIRTIIVGLLINIFVPLIFIFACSFLGNIWHSHREIQITLVGLAIIGAMPIAGSSATWAQNSEGNLAISLGLVVFSTLFSPITSPFGFHVASQLTNGEYSDALGQLARSGTTEFLILSVAIPSLLGIGIRLVFGEARIRHFAMIAKTIALVDLLLLNYSNAAAALPQAFVSTDYDFLVLIFCSTTALCILGFGGGFIISRFMKIDRPSRTALIFGLGMNNNGTGLVLATNQLGAHPLVLLPIIFFNLEQQIIAAVAGFFLDRKSRKKVKSAVYQGQSTDGGQRKADPGADFMSPETSG